MVQQNERPLSEAAELAGSALLKRVLASSSELRPGTRLPPRRFSRAVEDLIKREFVADLEVGCLLPGVKRRWVTERGLDALGASDEQRSWHSPDGVGNLLLYDLPRVEAANALMSQYLAQDLGLSGLHFCEGQPMFAVAVDCRPNEDPTMCVPLCWASMLDKEYYLWALLQALSAAMEAHSEDLNLPTHYTRLCLVGFDEWDATRFLTLASLSQLPGGDVTDADPFPRVELATITAWYYSDDGWCVSDGASVIDGGPPKNLNRVVPRRHSFRPRKSHRTLGTRAFQNIIDQCRWAGLAGHGLFGLVTLLGQYPVISLDHLKAFSGEGTKDTATKNRLARLVEMQLAKVVTAKAVVPELSLTVSPRGLGGPRYALTKAGMYLFCCAHGGRALTLSKRTRLGRLPTKKKRKDGTEYVTNDVWPYSHEDGLYEVLAQFFEMKCAIAAGWRATVTLADGRRINPDGVVLVRTPWGKLWCYLEFELSDRSPSAVGKRCGKYGAAERLDARPVLVVCYDDRAEKNFHEAGLACKPKLRMLTTTLGRVRESGVAGAGVWSHYGEPVTLLA